MRTFSVTRLTTRRVSLFVALATLLALVGLAPPAHTLTDTTPPQLVSLSFSTSTINTSAGPATVTVTAHITDDLSGISFAYGYFYAPSPSSQYVYAPLGGNRVSGTALDGIYQVTATFPQYGTTGTWTLGGLTLGDAVGNTQTISTASLVADGFPTQVAVSGTPDTTPPQLVSLSFSTSTINTSAGPATVTVTAHITDDVSGVSFAYGYFYAPSPSSQYVYAPLGGNRVSGTALDGIYQVTATFPRYGATGTWTLGGLTLGDVVGNTQTISTASLVADGFPTQVAVSGTPDTTPPQLVSLSFSTSTINTSAGPATVTVTAHITDDLSGISFAYGYFYAPSPSSQYVYAPLGGNRVSGTALDGIYQVTATFPQYGATGTWTLGGLTLGDVVGNTQTISTASLVADGFPTQVAVSNTPITGPDAPTIGTATAGNGSASVAFTAGSNGGSPVLHFDATCTSSTGGATGTASGGGTPIVVSGLTNGDTYTCSVTATNTVGTSPALGVSNMFVPATVPSAPTIGTSSAGNGSGSVAFTAGTNGGSTILHFTATCASSNGGTTGSAAGGSSPIVVSGLTSGDTYTCSVTATNAVGTGGGSGTSNMFVPTFGPAIASAVPSSGASGTVVAVSGSGWNPAGGPVSVHFSSGGDIAGATIDGSGNLSANISVGLTEAVGSNPIIVSQSSTVVTVPFTVTSGASAPTLMLAPGQGPPGTVVALSGQHWPTSGPMSVVFTSGTDTGTASVDGSGNLTGSITVGSSEPLGSDPIYVFDGSTFVSATFTVTAVSGAPTLVVNPVQGASGTTVALSGQRWNATGGSPVVSFEFGTDSGTASIDGSGNLTGSITVSAAEPLGANQIVVHQDTTAVGAAFTVVTASALSPWARANTNHGGIGTVVSFIGGNWDPHGGAVSVRFTHGPDTGTATVDGSGNLTGSITVGAAEAAGSNPIIITQGSTTVELSVGVLPSGGAGSSPPVGGGGLPPGSGVTITGPGGGSCTTTVNPDGTFSCPLPIHGPPGQYFYTVHDGSITYTIPFTVLPPTASATPTQGGSGTVVSISGTLWDPTGGPVTVKFAAGSDAGTATVDASGNLTGSITVGASEIVGSNPIILTQDGFSFPIPFTVLASTSTGGKGGHGDCTVTPTAPRSPSSAPGDGSATVSWGPPLKPTQECLAGDLVTPYLGGVAQTPTLIVGPGTTTVIKGLINGDKYTFDIATENGSVEGPTSVMTAPITIGSPQRVTDLSVLRGHGSVVLSWKAPKITNGKPITGYMIAAYLGSKLVVVRSFGATTSATIGKLTKGKAYTFVVAAENSRGIGEFVRSNPVKPT